MRTKENINISIDKDILSEMRAFLKERGFKMSTIVELVFVKMLESRVKTDLNIPGTVMSIVQKGKINYEKPYSKRSRNNKTTR